MKFLFVILLSAVVGAAQLAEKETEKACEGCPRPCGYTPPGRRPCCVSSDVIPPPPPPPPRCLDSSFYCPCDCPSSSSTVCPPPPVPIPPCPVICCDSSSSSSSSSSCQPCPYRRVPVPRPFLRCKSSSSSSSSSSCCTCHCRHHRHQKAALEVEEALVEKAQQAVVLEDRCKPSSSTTSVCVSSSSSSDCQSRKCPKEKALHTVFELDKKFVKYVNEQNLPGLYKLAQPGARYAMVTPMADQPSCTRVVGPLSQFLPNYIGNTLTSVFQDIVYNPDGSVTLHVLDILTNGCQTLIVQDVWRTYTSYSGCNYKIDYLNGVDWVCK